VGATKSVLKNCQFEQAKRRRTCARNKGHSIENGERCLVFKESMQSAKSYCLDCARAILEKGQSELSALIGGL